MTHRLSESCIAFDLDGTLVDSAPDLIGTLNRLLASEGLSPLAVSEARSLVGHGARALIRKGFSTQGLELTLKAEDEYVARFLTDYAENICRESRVFEGVFPVLQSLKASGAGLAVCTNKPQGLSEALLEALGLTPYFDVIKGADVVPAKKPDPAHIKACAEALGKDLAHTVLIGDSITDFQTSRAAQIPSILFSFGYSDPPVESLSPEALLSSYEDLIPTLARLGWH